MASHTVPAGHVGAHEKTLTMNAVDTVTFAVGGATGTPGWGASLPSRVEVLSDGVADIYVTVNGVEPTVGGSQCFRIPPWPGATVLDVRDANPEDAVVVKLVSAGAPTYSVSRAP